MKWLAGYIAASARPVTLSVRVWIEILRQVVILFLHTVTLSVRVWIEINHLQFLKNHHYVTLSVRVWIEILHYHLQALPAECHPQCEGVD